MARFKSDARAITCAVVMAAMLAGVTGCKAKRRRALLPKVTQFTLPSDEEETPHGGLEYRQTAGQAIAPVVVQDDPAPTVAPSAAPTQASGGGVATLNGHPNGITRETLNRSVQGAMGALATCFANVTQDPMVALSFEAQPDGRPSLVRVKGAPPDAERCIRNIVQNVRFPAFEGKGVQVDMPLSFHRVPQPTQPANRAGEQPTAPPLFLQP
jgi:hypothetical protein